MYHLKKSNNSFSRIHHLSDKPFHLLYCSLNKKLVLALFLPPPRNQISSSYWGRSRGEWRCRPSHHLFTNTSLPPPPPSFYLFHFSTKALILPPSAKEIEGCPHFFQMTCKAFVFKCFFHVAFHKYEIVVNNFGSWYNSNPVMGKTPKHYIQLDLYGLRYTAQYFKRQASKYLKVLSIVLLRPLNRSSV